MRKQEKKQTMLDEKASVKRWRQAGLRGHPEKNGIRIEHAAHRSLMTGADIHQCERALGAITHHQTTIRKEGHPKRDMDAIGDHLHAEFYLFSIKEPLLLLFARG